MHKRILYLFVFFLVNVAIARSQSFSVTPADTLVLDTTVSSCQVMNTMNSYIQNLSSTDTLHMSWRVSYNAFPRSWAVSYCYPGVCLSSSQIGVHTFHFTMTPSDTGSMELKLTPLTGTYTGYYQVLLWVTNDSANTATRLNYRATINAPCTNGITEEEAALISFYPNPVRSDLKVTLPQSLTNGQIDIYNLLGCKVFSQSINNRETTKAFDLSALQTGLYVARISDNGKIVVTKKFTKED